MGKAPTHLIFGHFSRPIGQINGKLPAQESLGAAMSVLGELKRRKIIQVIAVYAVVAWLVVQVITSIEEPLNLPGWTDTLVIVLLVLGFPVMLVLSWAFNVTPAGLVRDGDGEETSKSSGRSIEFVLIGLVGIAVVWLIYRTEFDSQPPPEPVAVEETAPDVLPNSVAVLPFANLSPDPDNAFFAAGIHDTILNELAKIRDMHVISRTTMIRYAETEKSMPQIAEELRVETVMEGSIQYANGRVLVTAQLIDPQTDTHLWSANYDRDIADVFAIQADIATQIAEALQAQISPEERQSIQQQMTDSPEAYAAYLQAMEIADWDLSPGDTYNLEFHDLLNKAIELDPHFARVYAVKAHITPSREEDLIVSLAEKALELDPGLGLAHSALGFVHHHRFRDVEAREEFDNALRLSPNDPNIMDDMSRYLSYMGEFDSAVALATRLNDIDPGFSGALNLVTWVSGDLEASVREARRLVRMNSTSHWHRLGLAVGEQLMGNDEVAQAQARIAKNLRQDEVFYDIALYTLPQTAIRYHVLGYEEDAKFLLDLFFERADKEMATPVSLAFAYLALDDYKKLMEQLQIIADEVDSGFRSTANTLLAANPYNDPMLDTPEFVEARRRLGYPKLVDR